MPVASGQHEIGPAVTNGGFAALGVRANVVDVLGRQGRTEPFAIQASTFQAAASGRDVLGKARTGSGKTLAFLLPVIHQLAGTRAVPHRPGAVILAPTRELASQIHAELSELATAASLITTVIFGGVNQHSQAQALQRGVNIVVACPGRMLDLIGQGLCELSAVGLFVIDEADHMADQGFLPMVRRLLAMVPQRCQQLWFSATLDNGVDALVAKHMRRPLVVDIGSADSVPGRIDHLLLVVGDDDRVSTIAELIGGAPRSVVFCRTKARTKKLTRALVAGGVDAVELHGNLAQNARTRNLEAFSSGRAVALVATDIAARGIHVDNVSLVIHADPPIEHKAYTHRAGRTGRAGASGTVVTVSPPEEEREVRRLLTKANVKHVHVPGDAAGVLRFVGGSAEPDATVPRRGAAPRSVPRSVIASTPDAATTPVGLVWPDQAV